MKTTLLKKIGKWTLPEECIACGAEDSYVRELTHSEKTLRGEAFTVEHHHWKCDACGVGVLGDEEMDEAMRATVAAYQKAHGLLTAADIRDARHLMKWSQDTLAARSGLGIATIKRLELGIGVQTEANDALLRSTLGTSVDGTCVYVLTGCSGVLAEWQAECENEAWMVEPMVTSERVLEMAAKSNNELALAA